MLDLHIVIVTKIHACRTSTENIVEPLESNMWKWNDEQISFCSNAPTQGSTKKWTLFLWHWASTVLSVLHHSLWKFILMPKKKLYMRWGWLWIHLTHNSTNLKTTLPTQRPTFGVRCVMSFTKPAMCRQKWNVLVKSSPPETRTRRKWWRGERLPHHGPILSSTIMSIFCEHSKPATPARCPLQVSYIRVKTLFYSLQCVDWFLGAHSFYATQEVDEEMTMKTTSHNCHHPSMFLGPRPQVITAPKKFMQAKNGLN